MWSRQKITILLIITTVLIRSNNGAKQKSPKVVYYISTKVDFNPEYLQDHYFTIAADRQTADIVLNIAKTFVYDPWAGITITFQNLKTKLSRVLFQYDINVCAILGKQGSQLNSFVSGWINNFWKYGDLPRSCPIKKGNYTWNNLRAEKLNIPNFISNGHYLININTYFRYGGSIDSIANLTIVVELK
ncbi:uncharacterized protein LOC111687192 isoform X2 [Lucilia cuprina]|uniref:uncharacterized protein LOC111687192 isoform X2 n=1 Tax=Lucilia cuprina TaxID=7375 RepID=UPI001F068E6D|nr:uncharacterized protein LOC111687192 isoform X2 [Lucilia cuprina]